MSYPRDLDDYSDDELINELARRCAERSKGNCDYCRRPRTETTISGVTRPSIACRPGAGRHATTEVQLRARLVKMGVCESPELRVAEILKPGPKRKR